MFTAEKYAEKKSAAQSKLNAYVDKVNANKPAANEVAGAKEALDKAVAEYNALVVSDAYERLFLLTADSTEVGPLTAPAEYLKSVDPLGRAFRAYRFAGLMKPSIKKDKDTGRIKSASLTYVADSDDDKNKQVFKLRDIEAKWDELQKAAGIEQKVPLMASPEWSVLVYRMQRLFTARSLSRGGYALPSGLTADYIVYDAEGKAVAVSELTADQKKALDDKISVKKLKDELQALVDAIYYDNSGRKTDTNKYRAVEKDVNWLTDNAHKFDERRHKTIMMTEALAFELAFCLTAHIVTGKAYDAILGE